MPHISSDRHKTLGPWVARNISAPATNVRARRYNAAVQLKAGSSSAFQPNYEFVEMSSRHYSSLPSRPAKVPEMADLNSKDVSDWLAKGELVLWPPEEGFEANYAAEELVEKNAVEEGSTSSTVVEQTMMLEKTLDDEAERAAVPQWNTDEHSTSLPVENTELALTQPWGTEKTADGGIQLSWAADEEMAVESMLQEELDDLQNVA
ncbi:hypothetical protein DFH08DRAFT_832506 [Mycena albidolilacea]|uniref:Uncharacterized protein n=1 Tax=Mycena albidolilacea TaxID=1033008 RepID=A0AAD7AVN2_9AGAR|nr:hypothetical protein DFH08DRAFT_832506 [Mycena albidolilacea]